MPHQLSPDAFPRIVELVDCSRLGTATSAMSVMWRYVIDAGHAPETFVGLSQRELADELGLGVSRAGVVLERLVKLRVLESDESGCGQRPNGYRFRDLAEWEVPWRGGRTSTEVALAVERWLKPVEVAAPAFARAPVRAQRPTAPARVRAVARAGTRALRPATEQVARTPGARALRPGFPGGVPTGRSAIDSVPPHGAAGAEEEVAIAPGDLERARRAVFARVVQGRRTFLNGEPKRRLERLIADHGVEAVVTGCEKVPPETYLVPHFVEHLVDVLERGSDELPPELADDRRRRLADKLAGLRRQKDLYEAEDPEMSQLAVIIDDIATCETELAALNAEGAA
jgi:hypothetical protein